MLALSLIHISLQLLEQRPASVLLADWLMPEIDGLELTARVRQLDETADHYTYIILLTGKEGENVLGEAFDRGVDDFISKAAMNEQLVPRVYAADRLCNTPVSYTHLDVYKRQGRSAASRTRPVPRPAAGCARRYRPGRR